MTLYGTRVPVTVWQKKTDCELLYPYTLLYFMRVGEEDEEAKNELRQLIRQHLSEQLRVINDSVELK